MIRSFGLRLPKQAVPLLYLLAAFLTQCPAHAETVPEPLRIPRVSRAPKLSDFITGTPREAEAVITVFKQFDPHDGEPISQPTAAYLSYDSKNLYIGWICKDDPSLIRARVAPRKQIDTDDRISIVIDTFQDHKHGYWFDTNPYGIQFDGRTTDGIGDDPSWEALWYTEGRILPTGYVVLQTIPFRSLRFPRASKQIWYISLARFIQRTNEYALWPFVSRKLLPQFVGQFAPIEIDSDISPGRNLQLIPYALFSKDSYLDPTGGFQHDAEHHPGLDAKIVLHDALTLDMTANPDFSEIGSDDPKVQANQRYEVVYPERRPFFLENASIFSMPEDLFFSRRIVDPQFGAKLTGSLGRWGMGALVADDRAPGEVLLQGQTGHGDRAIDAVFRTEREFAHQSHVGLFLSSTNFQSTSNRAASIDLRYLAAHNWVLTGQATTTQSQTGDNGYLAGPGFVVDMSRTDLHNTFETYYLDRSPGLAATLGYLSRSDIRDVETFYKYRWRPAGKGPLLAYGPSIDAIVNYDHEKRLENWSMTPGFSISLDRLTSIGISHSESYEFYSGIGFRAQNTNVNFATSWFQWLEMSAIFNAGTLPNYHPAAGVLPFLANSQNASATVTIRPNSHLRFDQIYYYTRLANGAAPASVPAQSTADIFTNHLLRAKINYQFNRDYAFNAIFDYNAMLPNGSLVDSDYAKQADTTLLFSYFPHPGTAFYFGYADTFQNTNYDATATPAYTVSSVPSTSTDRQLFIKVSYLFRF